MGRKIIFTGEHDCTACNGAGHMWQKCGCGGGERNRDCTICRGGGMADQKCRTCGGSGLR